MHKPLLTLMLLARAAAGEDSRISYAAVREPLTRLLREFGLRRQSNHPENPFWHLQTGGFWVVENAANLPLRKNGRSVTSSDFLKHNAHGHVPAAMWAALRSNRTLIWSLSETLLNEFWPDTLHSALRAAIGLEASPPELVTQRRAKRDPKFREAVIRAYERACAVCGYDGRLSDMPLGLEAAHIQWHCHSGPDAVANGLALCSFHHVALDKGALGLAGDGSIQVSVDVTGNDVTDGLLMRYAGKPLRRPQEAFAPPAEQFIAWHTSQVFCGPPRGSQSLQVAAEDRADYHPE